jgi:hypothetical protein
MQVTWAIFSSSSYQLFARRREARSELLMHVELMD